MLGASITLVCLALVVLYWFHGQAANSRAIICPHCDDLILVTRGTLAVCPSCKKLVIG